MLSSVDTIVFDVDGTLIDTYPSFRRTILETTAWVLKTKAGLIGGRVGTMKDTDLFKTCPGFNDDFDIAESWILFYLMKAKVQNKKALSVLRKLPPTLEEVISRCIKMGGGKGKFRLAAAELLGCSSEVKGYPLIARQVFREIYAGKEMSLIYGRRNGKRRLPLREGLWKQEKLLLKLPLKEGFRYALFTGRNRGETRCALAMLGDQARKMEAVVCADNGIRKPNTAGLRRIVQKLQTKHGLYIGDTKDDLMLVKRFNEELKREVFRCAMVGKIRLESYPHIKKANVNQVLRGVYAQCSS